MIDEVVAPRRRLNLVHHWAKVPGVLAISGQLVRNLYHANDLSVPSIEAFLGWQ